MVKLILTLFIINSSAFAAEAIISVLEAPLFITNDELSRIVQYHRKGEKIYIHSEELNIKRYDFLGADIEYDQAKELTDKYTETYKDAMFKQDTGKAQAKESKFIRTLDKRGHEAFILREHVEIVFDDYREFKRRSKDFDETDYRLDEPLTETYPLYKETGYRGFFTFGLGSQNETNYPYNQSIEDSGYTNRRDFSAIWSYMTGVDKKQRFYFGGMFSLTSSESQFVLEDRNTHETVIRIGVGPYLSYDAWKTEEYIFTFYSSILFNIANQTEVTQTDQDTKEDETRIYIANNFSPRFGGTLTLRDTFGTLDIITGFHMLIDLPHKLKSESTAQNKSWWTKEKDDEISKPFQTELNLFIGLQSDY